MNEVVFTGGVPGASYDDAWWTAVESLLDIGFPGLADGIERSAAVGARWRDVTTPFVAWAGAEPVAHVGVLRHHMLLDGRDVEVAGIHAVCSHPSWRRRGLVRTLLARATAWVDTWTAVAKLSTDEPDVYRSSGFEVMTEHRFRSSIAPDPNQRPPVRPLRLSKSEDDRVLLARMLVARTPHSRRCASLEPGWLFVMDCALQHRLDGGVLWLPDDEAIVVIDEHESGARVAEVVAHRPVDPRRIVALATRQDAPVWWTFAPDALDPQAVPVARDIRGGAFMVRGEWPTTIGPFGISPLWEH